MKLSSFSAAIAALCILPIAGAQQGSDAPASDMTSVLFPDGPIARSSDTTPESPAAAFARILAPRSPIASAAGAPAIVDPLDAPFQSALWTVPTNATIGIAAGPGNWEVQ